MPTGLTIKKVTKSEPNPAHRKISDKMSSTICKSTSLTSDSWGVGVVDILTQLQSSHWINITLISFVTHFHSSRQSPKRNYSHYKTVVPNAMGTYRTNKSQVTAQCKYCWMWYILIERAILWLLDNKGQRVFPTPWCNIHWGGGGLLGSGHERCVSRALLLARDGDKARMVLL